MRGILKRTGTRAWIFSLTIHCCLVGSLAFVALTIAPRFDDYPTVWMEDRSPHPDVVVTRQVRVESNFDALNEHHDLPLPAITDVTNLLSNHESPEEADETTSSARKRFDESSFNNARDLIASGSGWYQGSGTNGKESGGSLGLDADGEALELDDKSINFEAERDSIEKSLRWLAYHQEIDGRWMPQPGSTEGNAFETTALAALAMLLNRHSEKVGAYRDPIKSSLQWLKAHQRDDGSFFDDGAAVATAIDFENNFLGAFVLCEAARSARVPDTRDAAQRAIRYCIQIQWNNRSKLRNHRCWYVLALKSAMEGKLHLDPDAFIDAMPNSSIERNWPFRISNGDPWQLTRIRYYHNADRCSQSCAGPCPWCRMRSRSALYFLDHAYSSPSAGPFRDLSRTFVKAHGPPTWDHSENSVDLLTWFDGSIAAMRSGGDAYRVWRAKLVETLFAHQCKERSDDEGSWPAAGPLSARLGRSGQTALACLCLCAHLGRSR